MTPSNPATGLGSAVSDSAGSGGAPAETDFGAFNP